MAEVGCLKDGCFQNLKVEGNTNFETVTANSLTVEGNTNFETVTAKSLIVTGIQRLTTDAALVVAATTDLVLFAADATATTRAITLPPATVGRHIKFLWEVEQAGGDRLITRESSDTIVGMIFTTVIGDSAGDGDVVPLPTGSSTITLVDNISQGSCIDFYCGVAGTWVVNGQLAVDAVGSVPTIG